MKRWKLFFDHQKMTEIPGHQFFLDPDTRLPAKHTYWRVVKIVLANASSRVVMVSQKIESVALSPQGI